MLAAPPACFAPLVDLGRDDNVLIFAVPAGAFRFTGDSFLSCASLSIRLSIASEPLVIKSLIFFASVIFLRFLSPVYSVNAGSFNSCFIYVFKSEPFSTLTLPVAIKSSNLSRTLIYFLRTAFCLVNSTANFSYAACCCPFLNAISSNSA